MPSGRKRTTPLPRDGRVRINTSIRIKVSLRRRLESAAKRSGDSVNREIMTRLEASFDTDKPAKRRTLQAAE